MALRSGTCLLSRDEADDADLDEAALADALRVMLLLGEVPAVFKDGLSPELRRLVEEGERLRLAVPGYLEQRLSLLRTHLPLQPPGLFEVVAGYAEPSREELWATGLGRRRRRRRQLETGPLRRSLRLRQRADQA